MSAVPYPSEQNSFLAGHIGIIRSSYRHWTRRDLVPARMTDPEAARFLFDAPWVLLSHNTDPDPVFNYGNRTALSLFGMTWDELMACPSRQSAETGEQEARERLLREVAERGFSDDYRGIRIGRHGRRFLIEGATVFNLRDARGVYCGQAATFKHWTWV
jgi:hypothetical protein